MIIDWVPNHTSDRHPWFQASRSSRDDPKRDWYVWRDGRPGGRPPNDWLSTFGRARRGRSTPPPASGTCTRSRPEQPDLNWDNPEVEAAMLGTLRFWLDRGVDGFRIDVVHELGSAPTRGRRGPVAPGPGLAAGATIVAPHPRRARRVRRPDGRRRGVRARPAPPRVLPGGRRAAPGAQLRLPALPVEGAAFREVIDEFDAGSPPTARGPPGAWRTTTTRAGHPLRRPGRAGPGARGAAAAGLRGTPFIFQGQELGLPDARSRRTGSSTSTAATPSAPLSPGSRRRRRARAPDSPRAAVAAGRGRRRAVGRLGAAGRPGARTSPSGRA